VNEAIETQLATRPTTSAELRDELHERGESSRSFPTAATGNNRFRFSSAYKLRWQHRECLQQI